MIKKAIDKRDTHARRIVEELESRVRDSKHKVLTFQEYADIRELVKKVEKHLKSLDF